MQEEKAAKVPAYELVEVPERDGCKLVRTCDGTVIMRDYGEPEDKFFFRDFGGVVDEIDRLAALLEKAGIPIAPEVNKAK